MQRLEGLDREKIGNADGAEISDAAKVVAHQVDDHQIFGAVFDVGRKRVAGLRIGFKGAGAGRCPLHRPRLDGCGRAAR